jgi:pimeloyl-ACP methyl ester carboxylesterase
MPIDEALLAAHRSFSDPQAGIREEFLQPVLGGRRTVAVLTQPIGTARPLGWVICHSFGREQLVLQELDTLMARSLAAVGFPVVRYHGLGYGDSEGRVEDVCLTSHVGDASDAVGLLLDRTGVEAAGVAGARFGGMVAALVADRMALPLLAMWDPVVSGGQFMRTFVRTKLFFEAVAGAETGPASPGLDFRASPGPGPSEPGEPDSERSPVELLNEKGWVDVQGFRLSRRAYEEVSAVDLRRELSRFRGACLIASLSKSGEMRPDIAKLVAHLTSLGADCKVEPVQHRLVAEFGQRHYADAGESTKIDVQLELSTMLAEVAVPWAEEQAAKWRTLSERP